MAHDELKHAGGWYDDGFYGLAVVKKKRQNEGRVQSYRRWSLGDATVIFSGEWAAISAPSHQQTSHIVR
jgi:hypothetical protein